MTACSATAGGSGRAGTGMEHTPTCIADDSAADVAWHWRDTAKWVLRAGGEVTESSLRKGLKFTANSEARDDMTRRQASSQSAQGLYLRAPEGRGGGERLLVLLRPLAALV